MASQELTLKSRSWQLCSAAQEDLFALMSWCYQIRQMCWFIGRFLFHYKLLLCNSSLLRLRPWCKFVLNRMALLPHLTASNLHASRLNAICHCNFCAVCSICKIRAEFCLGQSFHWLIWGASSNLFRARAASFRSTHGIQGNDNNQIYSIVCMNEISTPMSKFVSCWFRAPSSIANARTHVHSCPRFLLIALVLGKGLAQNSACRSKVASSNLP